MQETVGQNPICNHGDSGGPVYAFNGTGVTAVGMITLVARTANGGDDTRHCWYTSMRSIMQYWDAAIVRGG